MTKYSKATYPCSREYVTADLVKLFPGSTNIALITVSPEQQAEMMAAVAYSYTAMWKVLRLQISIHDAA